MRRRGPVCRGFLSAFFILHSMMMKSYLLRLLELCSDQQFGQPHTYTTTAWPVVRCCCPC
jgi:hypothetical protein